MNISFWAQTWVDVDFLAVGKLAKTIFPMGWSQKRTSYLLRLCDKKVNAKVNQKRKTKGSWNLKVETDFFFTSSYHLRPVLLFSEATPASCMNGILHFIITDAIDSQFS